MIAIGKTNISTKMLCFSASNVFHTDATPTDGSAYAAQAELILQNDRYLFELTRTRIGEAFDPALGFVPRRLRGRELLTWRQDWGRESIHPIARRSESVADFRRAA